jgi:hypothetical protein
MATIILRDDIIAKDINELDDVGALNYASIVPVYQDGITKKTSINSIREGLQTNGFASKVATLSTNYTIVPADQGTLFSCDATGQTITITLPLASTNLRAIFSFIRIGSVTNAARFVDIITTGSEVISATNRTSYKLTDLGETLTIISTGTIWVVINYGSPISGRASFTSNPLSITSKVAQIDVTSYDYTSTAISSFTISNPAVQSKAVIRAWVGGNSIPDGYFVAVSNITLSEGSFTIKLKNVNIPSPPPTPTSGSIVIYYVIHSFSSIY